MEDFSTAAPDAYALERDVLEGLAQDHLCTEGPDLLQRWDRHEAFWTKRAEAGLDPYGRSSLGRIGPEARVSSRRGGHLAGVNFASQDYLSLSSHPRVQAAAIAAIGQWGLHSAGSIALQGGTGVLLELEARLAAWLDCSEVMIFPTGWAAGYGVVRTLVREDDHVVIDSLAHACLSEGASAATRKVHRVTHLSTEAVERRLVRIRQSEPQAGILVLTESLFSMDSDVPEIDALQTLCRSHGATLVLDVAHDLGAIGEDGLGFLGRQGMVGRVDVVMGSFSKTFASNGGFVASSASGLKQALRAFAGPLTFSNALSPVQAAVVLAALDIIQSAEGAQRRAALLRNVMQLRQGLGAKGFSLLGQPSAIIPVRMGGIANARRMTRAALTLGGLVNLVEHPAVSRNNSRWRLQVMADHSEVQIERMLEIAAEARRITQPRNSLALVGSAAQETVR